MYYNFTTAFINLVNFGMLKFRYVNTITFYSSKLLQLVEPRKVLEIQNKIPLDVLLSGITFTNNTSQYSNIKHSSVNSL